MSEPHAPPEEARAAPTAAPAPEAPRMAQGLPRVLLRVLAVLCLGLAVLGAILPGMPTTVFVLIAAWAAARSSPRLHAWLLAHRVFGSLIRNWEQGGCVSRRAKWSATAAMLLCTALMWHFHRESWTTLLAVGCMSAVALWLWLRPEPPAPPG